MVIEGRIMVTSVVRVAARRAETTLLHVGRQCTFSVDAVYFYVAGFPNIFKLLYIVEHFEYM